MLILIGAAGFSARAAARVAMHAMVRRSWGDMSGGGVMGVMGAMARLSERRATSNPESLHAQRQAVMKTCQLLQFHQEG
jgi:crotonobetainyl-CoA:carnitine CoA-transferase CaiB-like acyl-CoA transferase